MTDGDPLYLIVEEKRKNQPCQSTVIVAYMSSCSALIILFLFTRHQNWIVVIN